MTSLEQWPDIFRDWLSGAESLDPAHNLPHVERVAATATKLAAAEDANMQIVLPAAWLHDCLIVPKDSEKRSQASRLAADKAIAFLVEREYPQTYYEAIHHAIVAHSFSANIHPETLEAMVVQDADRLDALGAIGLSRCLMLGGHLDKKLFNSNDPFCKTREADDSQFVIDHFFAKLLKLVDTMNTDSAKMIARERTDFLLSFLRTLEEEI